MVGSDSSALDPNLGGIEKEAIVVDSDY